MLAIEVPSTSRCSMPTEPLTIPEMPGFVDRTVRLLREMSGGPAEARLVNASAGITADPAALETETGRQLVSFGLNLLARTFVRVSLLPPIGTTHLTKVYREFEQMWGFPWPAIETSIVQAASEADAVLAIGTAAPANGRLATMTIGCEGWVIECHAGPGPVRVRDGPNPVGVAAAVSVGVARLFGDIVARELPESLRSSFQGPPALRWSTYSYRNDDADAPLPSGLHLDDVLLVGVGGVGAAIAAVLGLQPGLTGRVLLVDPDQVDESNLNRFLTATRSAIGRSKTEIAHEHLKRRQPSLQVLSAPFSYQRVVRQLGRPLATVVSSVDSEPLRAIIQSDLPKTVIDAATSGPVIGLSRHTFVEGACLGCLHPRTNELLGPEVQMAKILGQPLSFVIDRLADDTPLSPRELQVLAERLNLGPLQFSRGKPLRVFWAEDVCGRMPIPAGTEPAPTAGSAAFISVLAGALAAGELLKDAAGANPLDNELKVQVFRGPDREFPRRRAKDPKCSCFCSDLVMQEAYGARHNRSQQGGRL